MFRFLKSAHRKTEFGSTAASDPASVDSRPRPSRREPEGQNEVDAPSAHLAMRNSPKQCPAANQAAETADTHAWSHVWNSCPSGATATEPFPSAKLRSDVDPDSYRSLARNFAEGKGFVAVAPDGHELPNVARTPAYPLFLAGLIGVGGDRSGAVPHGAMRTGSIDLRPDLPARGAMVAALAIDARRVAGGG